MQLTPNTEYALASGDEIILATRVFIIVEEVDPEEAAAAASSAEDAAAQARGVDTVYSSRVLY